MNCGPAWKKWFTSHSCITKQLILLRKTVFYITVDTMYNKYWPCSTHCTFLLYQGVKWSLESNRLNPTGAHQAYIFFSSLLPVLLHQPQQTEMISILQGLQQTFSRTLYLLSRRQGLFLASRSVVCWKGWGIRWRFYPAPEILLGRSLACEDYTLTLLEGATWQMLLV